MKDVPGLRAHLQEIAASSPSAKPMDARARRRVRRRQTTLIAGTALSLLVVATTGFALTGAGGSGDPDARTAVSGERGSPPGDCVWTIATMGGLSGEYERIGEPIVHALEYAVAEANERGDLACAVDLRKEDSDANPHAAARLARSLTRDRTVVACVCPYFWGETLTSGPVFSSGGLLMSGISTNSMLDEQGLETWFGALALDDVLGLRAGELIAAGGAENVAVIDDGQEYPLTVAAAVRRALGERVGGTFAVDPAQDDYSAVAEGVAGMGADFVFFAGYAPEAGPLLKDLRDAGVDAPFLVGPASKHPELGRLAKGAAHGTLAVCACADATRISSAAAFVAGMRERHGGADPGEFAVEAYDVATLVMEALRAYEGDPADTAALRAYVVRHFDETNGYEGLAKTYSWEDDGELEARTDAVWVYEWDDAEGGFVARGPLSDNLD